MNASALQDKGSRELQDITTENDQAREHATPPRSIAQYLVGFPVTEDPKSSSCTRTERPIINRKISLASSPASKENVSTETSSLTRVMLDRRTSLPALGIDLGRSGPSYGHTVKRSTVAVYGMAREVFDPVTGALALSDVTAEQPISADLHKEQFRSPVLNSSQWTANQRRNTDENKNESSTDVSSPLSASTPFIRPKATSNFGRQTHNKLIFHQNHLSQSVSSLNFRPPSLSKNQTIGRFNSTSVRRPKNIMSRAATLNLQSRSHNAETLKNEDLVLSKTEEPVTGESENSQELDRDDGRFEENISDLLERVRKKRLIIRELIETERRYLAVLEKIDQHYLKPIQRSQRREDSSYNLRNSRYSAAFVRMPSTSSPPIVQPAPSGHILPQKEILSISTTADIFSNFSAILSLAREFLSILEEIGNKSRVFDPDLEYTTNLEFADDHTQKEMISKRNREILATSEELMVGKILSPLWPFFKLYTVFTANFAVSQSRLHTHSTKPSPNPEFVKLLSDCSKRGIDSGLGLSNMLLAIIQRVPRYELLITDLIKNSSQQFDPDYPHLLSSKRMLSYVARRLETAMKDQEERTKILDVQRSMEGLNFPLVIPTRKLVKVGLLQKLGRKGDLRDRIFFLFNDCLIYAGLLNYYSNEALDTWIRWLTVKPTPLSKTNSHSSYSMPVQSPFKNSSSLLGTFGYGEENRTRLVFCLKMDLDDVNVVGTAGGMGENQKGFQILSSAKSFVVYAESTEVKEDWITALREAKHDMLGNRGTLFLTDSNTNNQPQRRPRSNQRHAHSSSPPLRVESWVSFGSSDGTGSSALADGSEPGISSPTSSGPIGNDRTIDEGLNHNSAPGMTSSLSSNLTSSMMSLFKLKTLVNRGLFTSGLPDSNQFNLQGQALQGQQDRNTPMAQGSLDDNFLFVAENYSAPVWVPDNKASRCMACQERFSLLRRRHHCRLCGCVFCATCSCRSFIIAHPDEIDRYARSCEACYKSVFIIPQSTNNNDNLKNQQITIKQRPWLLTNRPHDDLDLIVSEQRNKKAYFATHRHRQSLPLALDSTVCKQLCGIQTDHRSSLISSTTVEEEVVVSPIENLNGIITGTSSQTKV
ncbi:hypothetical protein CROQUDRAFT_95907 [Cronartium quercuum f. sp. fusiforme G11]|uniref:Uncharacterized protein n=1 Tax=Cronartium quercuum f. sp. fusiforme G11 TaxID=708437 RepID=A0A9P6NHL9_9BASI|nr:hypothetical protein CROQUDRAFT_95907 [Cronartium quercuum f. sp. fusiforme G11]